MTTSVQYTHNLAAGTVLLEEKMNSTSTDLFPPSMPNLESPQIFDVEMNATIPDEDLFFNQALTAESPGALFGVEPLSVSPFASPIPIKSPVPNVNALETSHEMGLSASPDSSMQDSSSDTSSQPRRKASSRSSNDGLHPGSMSIADARLKSWKNAGAMASNNQTLNSLGLTSDNLQHMDFDVQHMDNDLFDFDSAASSPSPNLISRSIPNFASRHIAIPFRDSPRTVPTILNRGRSLTVSTFATWLVNH